MDFPARNKWTVEILTVMKVQARFEGHNYLTFYRDARMSARVKMGANPPRTHFAHWGLLTRRAYWSYEDIIISERELANRLNKFRNIRAYSYTSTSTSY